MAEELKHLIEQIQKEGVDKAEQEAATIISQAKEKAAKLVAKAETKAADVLTKAKTEAAAFEARGTKTLEQSARDLLITVGQGVEKVISGILSDEVDQALDPKLLEKLILNLAKQSEDPSMTVAVSEADQKALKSFCAGKCKKELEKEIELQTDNEVLKGLKVGFKNENVYLDFTGEAIAETLTAFLRPELAKIVSTAAREQLESNA